MQLTNYLQHALACICSLYNGSGEDCGSSLGKCKHQLAVPDEVTSSLRNETRCLSDAGPMTDGARVTAHKPGSCYTSQFTCSSPAATSLVTSRRHLTTCAESRDMLSYWAISTHPEHVHAVTSRTGGAEVGNCDRDPDNRWRVKEQSRAGGMRAGRMLVLYMTSQAAIWVFRVPRVCIDVTCRSLDVRNPCTCEYTMYQCRVVWVQCTL